MGRRNRLYEEQLSSNSLETYIIGEEDIVPNEDDEPLLNEDYEEEVGDYDIQKYWEKDANE